jgi:hypothetical protein
MGLKIEREKAALMHVNKKSATLMRATKASDSSRSIQVSDEKEGLGLGQIGLRFAKKKPDRQGYAAPRSQRGLCCAEKPEGRCTGSEKGRNSCT